MEFSCSSWYPRFSNFALKSIILHPPQSFIDFLHEDSIIIPPSAHSKDFCDNEFHNSIRRAISDLGGKVFIKTNWSSPKDAAFMTYKGLGCETPGDILLLLKSSSLIAHDINYRGIPDNRIELVLKKYYKIDASREFRVFVRDSVVIGISQRDVASFYPFLSEEKENLKNIILRFCDQIVFAKTPLKDFVLDVYISSNSKCWIVDFNDFNDLTEPLLFCSWDQINNLTEECEILVVESPEKTCSTNDYLNHYPVELVDWMSQGQDFESFIRMIQEGINSN